MTELNDVVPLVLAQLARPQTTILDGGFSRNASGQPVLPAGEYIVLYTDAPQLTPGRLTSDYRRQMLAFRPVCVGRDAGEARDAASWALSRLSGWRPLPGDLTVGKLAPVPDGAPVLPDRSVPGDIRYSQTLVFHLATTRS